jgi:hypothetical protein
MTEQTIHQKCLDLYQRKAFAHQPTLIPDGSLRIKPSWVDYDDKFIPVNSAYNRQKFRNMQQDVQGKTKPMNL